MALIGVCVILSWSFGLWRTAGTVLLDMVPDRRLAGSIRKRLEVDGDRVSDLHSGGSALATPASSPRSVGSPAAPGIL